MSKTGIRAYDAARYLKDEADCAGYLRAVMEDDGVTEKEIASALGDIARARGMVRVAREAGVSREALYRALSDEGNPTLGTVLKVARVLGLRAHREQIGQGWRHRWRGKGGGEGFTGHGSLSTKSLAKQS